MRTKLNWLGIVLAVVALLAVSAGCGSDDDGGGGQDEAAAGSDGGGDLGTIKISMVPNLLATGAPWVADELGLFEKRGLDVELVYSGSGPSATQAWLAGDADLNAGSVLNLPSLTDQGIDYTAVSGVANSAAYQVLVRDGLDAPPDDLTALKGRRLCSIGTFVDTIFGGLAEEGGLSQSDLKLVQFQSFPAVVAAIGQGECDFTVATAPFTQQMVAQGAKVWRDLGKDGPAAIRDIPNIAVTGKSEWVDSNAEALKALVEGIAEVTQIAREDPDRVMDVAVRVIKPPDPAAFKKENAATLESWSPELTAEQIEYVNHLLVDVRKIAKSKPDPAEVIWPEQAGIFEKAGVGAE